ncbi:MAG: hypothetical protein V2A73_07240 [Pseudomonadota bacterium]
MAGALAEHADGVLAGMSPEQVRVARELLVGLVTPEGTRRVVSVDEVMRSLGTDGQAVLGTLSQARLVTLRKGADEDGCDRCSLVPRRWRRNQSVSDTRRGRVSVGWT